MMEDFRKKPIYKFEPADGITVGEMLEVLIALGITISTEAYEELPPQVQRHFTVPGTQKLN